MKKLLRLLSLILAAALCLALSSCGKDDKNSATVGKIADEYDYMSTYQGDGIGYVVAKEGKYGIIDKNGNYILEPTFENIYSTFSENMLVAQDNKQLVFIDMKGNVIIRSDADVVDEFYDGVAACCYYNESTETFEYSYISKETGKRINETVYYSAKAFSEGYGVCCVKETGLYGFVKPDGTYLIEPQYKNAGSFRNGLAPVMLGEAWGFIDTTGKVVIEAQFQNVAFFEEDGLCRAKKNDKWGFIDKTGKFVIEPSFDELNVFHEGFAVVCKDAKYGVIDTKGKTVLKIEYDNVSAFSEGYFSVYKDGKWGFADSTGKVTITPQYSFTSVFSEGLAAAQVSTDSLCGFIDKNNTEVIAPAYKAVSYFHNGNAIVETEEGLYGIIDKSGSYIVQPEFNYIEEILPAE